MTTIERAEAAEEIWKVMLPDVKSPDPRQFALWVCKFDDTILNKAFSRAAIKFANLQAVPCLIVWKYVSGVAQNETQAIERSSAMGRMSVGTV